MKPDIFSSVARSYYGVSAQLARYELEEDEDAEEYCNKSCSKPMKYAGQSNPMAGFPKPIFDNLEKAMEALSNFQIQYPNLEYNIEPIQNEKSGQIEFMVVSKDKTRELKEQEQKDQELEDRKYENGNEVNKNNEKVMTYGLEDSGGMDFGMTGSGSSIDSSSAYSLPSAKADVTKKKAKKILKDGSVREHDLTDKKKEMFGAIAGR